MRHRRRGSRLRPCRPLLRRTRRGAIVPRPRNDGGRPNRGAVASPCLWWCHAPRLGRSLASQPVSGLWPFLAPKAWCQESLARRARKCTTAQSALKARLNTDHILPHQAVDRGSFAHRLSFRRTFSASHYFYALGFFDVAPSALEPERRNLRPSQTSKDL